MIKIINIIKLLFASWVLLFASVVSANNQIYQLRSNSTKEKLQIVVDVENAPTFNAFALSSPVRLVVDVNAQASQRFRNRLDFKNRGVTLVRSGLRSENEVRLVLDFIKDYRWEVYALKPEKGRGHRMVIDVYDNGGKGIKPTKENLGLPKLTPEEINVVLESINEIDDNPAVIETPAPKVTVPAVATATPIKPAVKSSATPSATATPITPKPTVAISKPSQSTAKPKPPSNKAPISSQTAKAIDTTARNPNQKEIVIMIDPGHGGKDSGALGKKGTREKDVVLQISKRLKRKIDAMPNMRAVLTRNRDKYITLRGRLRLARKHKADLFVSIHADAFTQSSVKGSSVFILSNRGATSEAARWLARRENSVDLKYGIDIGDYDKDVSNVLMQIQQDATIESSYMLAKKTLGEMKRIGKVHKHYVERAGFAVLKSPDIPSMLVETAFISNPAEEKRLKSKAYQEKLATSIAKGIKKYFDEHLPHHLLLINAP